MVHAAPTMEWAPPGRRRLERVEADYESAQLHPVAGIDDTVSLGGIGAKSAS